MFRQVYEAATAIFLLQGVLIPVLLLVAGILWLRQMARLSALKKAVARDGRGSFKSIEALLAALPRLRPLTCKNCGAPVAIEAAKSVCVGCGTAAPLPEDHRATLSLRRRLVRLSAAAIRHWRVARALTSAPVRWLFRLMVIGEPAIFLIVAIGAATYTDTIFDRAFEAIGEGWSFALMLLAFAGFILWMIVFLFLASLARKLRRKLPAFPAVRRRDLGGTEYAACRSCGGGLAIAPGRFAALCLYCAVPNYRARFARAERAGAEAEHKEARASLFAAMEINEDYVGTFFVTMSILSVAFAILVAISALGSQ